MTEDIPPKALARKNSAAVALDHAAEAVESEEVEAFRERMEDARDLLDEGLEVLENDAN